MRKDEFPLIDKIRNEARRKEREKIVKELEKWAEENKVLVDSGGLYYDQYVGKSTLIVKLTDILEEGEQNGQ